MQRIPPALTIASALAGLGMLKTIGILKYCTDSFVKASNYWTTSSEHYYDYRTALQRFPINIAWQSHSTQWRLDTTSVRENRSVRYKLTYTEHLKTWFKWLCMGIKICIHACTLIITEIGLLRSMYHFSTGGQHTCNRLKSIIIIIMSLSITSKN